MAQNHTRAAGQQPCHPRPPNQRDTIGEVLTAAGTTPPGATFCDRSIVTPAAAKRIRTRTGLGVGGFSHSIDESAVRHTRRRHGKAGEADRTVTDDDLRPILPEVVRNPDSLRLAPVDPRRPAKLAAIEFRRRSLGDGLVAAEVRTGNKQLALLSMRKEKAAGA